MILYQRNTIWWCRWTMNGRTVVKSTRCRDEAAARLVAASFAGQRLTEVAKRAFEEAAHGFARSALDRTLDIGVVYFVQTQAETCLIKIGFTQDIRKRVAVLEMMSATAIDLAGHMPGSRADERALHQRFAHLRHHGEWFEAGDELIDFILKNCPCHSAKGVGT